ncbi:MAG: dihydrodipicolinate synthase family protein, partial [Burkholderiales bacterium]|nr:dihydrodipicolinate synthase family protein [Burkholderiales bacterium]
MKPRRTAVDATWRRILQALLASPVSVSFSASATARPTVPVPTFEGVWPILATPFDADDQVDLASLDRLVRFMVDAGADGVTVTGVLGESARLLDRERVEIVRTAVAAADGRVPVIVGTSHSGTLAARSLSQEAEALGAAAVMLTPHAEATPNDARVFEYYRSVADGVSIAVVVQDHPASSGVHMPAPLLLKLVADVPRVACIKLEAVPTATKLRALKAGFRARTVPILTGLGALYGLFDLRAGSSGFNTGFAFP